MGNRKGNGEGLMRYVSLAFKTIAVAVGLSLIIAGCLIMLREAILLLPLCLLVLGALFICPNRLILKNRIRIVSYVLLTGIPALFFTQLSSLSRRYEEPSKITWLVFLAILAWSPLISLLTALMGKRMNGAKVERVQADLLGRSSGAL